MSRTDQHVWVLSRDLMFPSGIPSALGAGYRVRMLSQLPEVPEGAELSEDDVMPDYVLIDLDSLRDTFVQLIPQIQLRYACGIVGFGSHVHPERLAAARQAGCQEVTSRGKLLQAAREILERCRE